ncbi:MULTISPECIES: CocE/NonD family hydrolase [unclassified Sphingobium]|uniref:CocE/NonD family hydrolase n=1 Tax=unclassified Sphingobium TaxID=2611147 RepID=UPI0035A6E45A
MPGAKRRNQSGRKFAELTAIFATIFGACSGGFASAQTADDERPAVLKPVTEGWNYERRVVDIPMRDGVKLHTIILIPKGAKDAPILLTRSPYNAEASTRYANSGNLAMVLDGYRNMPDLIVSQGYIRVIQDIRGMNGSGGAFVLHNNAADASDAYETIDWLSKNVPESNGRIGMIGVSYDGHGTLVALDHPHPALKVVVDIDGTADTWRASGLFNNGAFRQMIMPLTWNLEATRNGSSQFNWNQEDLYDAYLRAGSVGEWGRQHGMDQIGLWRKLSQHPAYDSVWQSQNLVKVLADQPLTVPMMVVHGLWDGDDAYGAMTVYNALKPKDTAGNMVYLTLGPWTHGQESGDGSHTGNIVWDHDTAKWWRFHVLAPFLNHYLKDEPMDVAPVTAFQSGTNEWQRLPSWPAAPATTKLFLQPGLKLGFSATDGGAKTEDYISDPAHPVNFLPRPVHDEFHESWKPWLTSDQRNSAARPDVLTFTTDVLTKPVTIAGEPVVHLTASTSGTDSDWVVKLIDVYPDQTPLNRAMGGYQLGIAMEIFRGRYRESVSEPKPLKANAPLAYRFALPHANHVFLPGHRIMVQVQSSWFPVFDRNPQTFVPNIFFAKPADYVKATQKVVVSGPGQSYIDLPLAR